MTDRHVIQTIRLLPAVVEIEIRHAAQKWITLFGEKFLVSCITVTPPGLRRDFTRAGEDVAHPIVASARELEGPMVGRRIGVETHGGFEPQVVCHVGGELCRRQFLRQNLSQLSSGLIRQIHATIEVALLGNKNAFLDAPELFGGTLVSGEVAVEHAKPRVGEVGTIRCESGIIIALGIPHPDLRPPGGGVAFGGEKHSVELGWKIPARRGRHIIEGHGPNPLNIVGNTILTVEFNKGARPKLCPPFAGGTHHLFVGFLRRFFQKGRSFCVNVYRTIKGRG